MKTTTTCQTQIESFITNTINMNTITYEIFSAFTYQ